ELVTHWSSAVVAPRSLPIAGLAMATTEPSSCTMSRPNDTAISASQGLPRRPAGLPVPARGSGAGWATEVDVMKRARFFLGTDARTARRAAGRPGPATGAHGVRALRGEGNYGVRGTTG